MMLDCWTASLKWYNKKHKKTSEENVHVYSRWISRDQLILWLGEAGQEVITSLREIYWQDVILKMAATGVPLTKKNL